MSRGLFITFEGLDGSGKTTQLRLLHQTLLSAGHTVVTLRQPGGTPLGDSIRDILLNTRSESTLGGIAPAAEMALMFADRAQSLAAIVLPALTAGSIVLCDRFTDSSEAYQGAGRQLGPDRVLEIHHAVCGDVQPDLTILLLPPLEASLVRARRRNERFAREHGGDENRFEREGDAFYRRVYDQYRTIARRDLTRVVVFEGAASIETIAAKITDVTQARLAARRPTSSQNEESRTPYE